MSIGKTVAFQRADRFLAEPAQAAGAPALVVIVGVAVMALGSNKLGERGGRLLKLLSGAVMLALGVVLLLRPQWLL